MTLAELRRDLRARARDEERALVLAAVRAEGGDLARAARRLGVLPRGVENRVRALGLRREVARIRPAPDRGLALLIVGDPIDRSRLERIAARQGWRVEDVLDASERQPTRARLDAAAQGVGIIATGSAALLGRCSWQAEAAVQRLRAGGHRVIALRPSAVSSETFVPGRNAP